MAAYTVHLAVALLAISCVVSVEARTDQKPLAPMSAWGAGDGGAGACAVSARTESGVVCGARRRAARGTVYASFRGVPYARQPLGQLRFKELQPAEPWDVLDASEEGPVCPQHDVFYGRLMAPQSVSEECIHANIHVPLPALPAVNQGGLDRHLRLPHPAGRLDPEPLSPGLPVLVFIHGGGFAFGSGDADVHGPEHLVSEGVIVITFNYRLNVFGFLSLNTPSVPGNNGLRDMVTLLRWVQRNARFFGGDPNEVTLAGQSAGASAAHLLSLSPAAEGLFKRVVLMSGTAIPSFYTTSPVYAQFVADMLFKRLRINSSDPEETHRQLTEMPLQRIMDANRELQAQNGVVVFLPVIESPIAGVTTILDADTEVLLAKGRGKDIPLLVGYTNVECEVFRPRFKQLDMLTRIKAIPSLVLSPTLIFSLPEEAVLERAKQVEQRYFNGTLTMDKYITSCSDTYYKYPALRLAEYRQSTGGAPMFLYEFSYNADYSVLREAMQLNYTGSGHVEDLTFVFRVNSVPVQKSSSDNYMRSLMTTYVTNFMRFSHPTCNDTTWQPVGSDGIRFQSIQSPELHFPADLTPAQRELLDFFNSIQVKPSKYS